MVTSATTKSVFLQQLVFLYMYGDTRCIILPCTSAHSMQAPTPAILTAMWFARSSM